MSEAKKDYYRILEFMPEEIHGYCETYIEELEKQNEKLVTLAVECYKIEAKEKQVYPPATKYVMIAVKKCLWQIKQKPIEEILKEYNENE